MVFFLLLHFLMKLIQHFFQFYPFNPFSNIFYFVKLCFKQRVGIYLFFKVSLFFLSHLMRNEFFNTIKFVLRYVLFYIHFVNSSISSFHCVIAECTCIYYFWPFVLSSHYLRQFLPCFVFGSK